MRSRSIRLPGWRKTNRYSSLPAVCQCENPLLLYMDSKYKDKTTVRPSYFYGWNSYTGMYWNGFQMTFWHGWLSLRGKPKIPSKFIYETFSCDIHVVPKLPILIFWYFEKSFTSLLTDMIHLHLARNKTNTPLRWPHDDHIPSHNLHYWLSALRLNRSGNVIESTSIILCGV